MTKILMGKDRVFNRRLQNLAFHYLFEPVVRTPGADGEKGQIERQVGVMRQRLFARRRKFADLDELNQWLRDEFRVMAADQKHPEFPGQTVAEVAARERNSLVSIPVLFDGYQETTARVSPTALVSFDRNRYSVLASSVGNSVVVRAYADRVNFIHNGHLAGLHRRQFGPDKTVFDPWHYLDVLKQKSPGRCETGYPSCPGTCRTPSSNGAVP